MAQKKDIKRQKERLEALKKEAEQEKAKAKEAARDRVLADFEKGQLGLAGAAVAASAALTTSGSEVTGDESSNFIIFAIVTASQSAFVHHRARDQAQIRVRFHCGGKARAGSRRGGVASDRA